MRRDNDLIRKLMMDMEADPDPLFVFVLEDDAEDERIYFHLRLLADEAMLEETGRGGGTFRMTNKGHDFVQAIRDDTIWSRTKSAIEPVAGASLSMLKDVALGYLRQELEKRGIPFG